MAQINRNIRKMYLFLSYLHEMTKFKYFTWNYFLKSYYLHQIFPKVLNDLMNTPNLSCLHFLLNSWCFDMELNLRDLQYLLQDTLIKTSFEHVLKFDMPNILKVVSNFYKNLYLKYMTGIWICPWRKQPPQVFYKKGVLKHFAILKGKHLCWSLLLINLQALPSWK